MSDDGLPLPAEDAPLERCCAATLAGLGPLLASPLFLDRTLLVQTTGGCWPQAAAPGQTAGWLGQALAASQRPSGALLSTLAPPEPMPLPAGVEEVVVRRYSLRATGGGPVSVAAAGAQGKPPGSGLSGSVFEATILLQLPREAAEAGWSGDGQQYMPGPRGGAAAVPPAHLPASAEEVAGSLQQLVGMLRVLAPPVCLLMRLNGVLLQVGAGLRAGRMVPPAHRWACSGDRHSRCPLNFCSAALPPLPARHPTAPCSQSAAAGGWTFPWDQP